MVAIMKFLFSKSCKKNGIKLSRFYKITTDNLANSRVNWTLLFKGSQDFLLASYKMVFSGDFGINSPSDHGEKKKKSMHAGYFPMNLGTNNPKSPSKP